MAAPTAQAPTRAAGEPVVLPARGHDAAHHKPDRGNPNDDDDDDDEGAVWETASLFEEILDDVAAFEYSTSSEFFTLTPAP